MSLQEALTKAREQDLDLVEVADKGDVVIAKIIDWQKHLFIEKKKKTQSASKKVELKTLRLSYAI